MAIFIGEMDGNGDSEAEWGAFFRRFPTHVYWILVQRGLKDCARDMMLSYWLVISFHVHRSSKPWIGRGMMATVMTPIESDWICALVVENIPPCFCSLDVAISICECIRTDIGAVKKSGTTLDQLVMFFWINMVIKPVYNPINTSIYHHTIRQELVTGGSSLVIVGQPYPISRQASMPDRLKRIPIHREIDRYNIDRYNMNDMCICPELHIIQISTWYNHLLFM